MLKGIRIVLLVTVFGLGSGTSVFTQTIQTVCNGSFNDATIWNLNRIPMPGDSILIHHLVNFPSDRFITNAFVRIDELGGLCGEGELQVTNTELDSYGFITCAGFHVQSSQVNIYGNSQFGTTHLFGVGTTFSVTGGGSTVVSDEVPHCLTISNCEPALFRLCDNTVKCNVSGDVYQWYRDDSLLTDQGDSLLLVNTGTYSVSVIDTTTLDTLLSDEYNYQGPAVCSYPANVASDPNDAGAEIALYPTVTANWVTLVSTGKQINFMVAVDVMGRQHPVAFRKETGEQRLNLSTLPPGLYHLLITLESGEVHSKPVIRMR